MCIAVNMVENLMFPPWGSKKGVLFLQKERLCYFIAANSLFFQIRKIFCHESNGFVSQLCELPDLASWFISWTVDVLYIHQGKVQVSSRTVGNTPDWELEP